MTWFMVPFYSNIYRKWLNFEKLTCCELEHYHDGHDSPNNILSNPIEDWLQQIEQRHNNDERETHFECMDDPSWIITPHLPHTLPSQTRKHPQLVTKSKHMFPQIPSYHSSTLITSHYHFQVCMNSRNHFLMKGKEDHNPNATS